MLFLAACLALSGCGGGGGGGSSTPDPVQPPPPPPPPPPPSPDTDTDTDGDGLTDDEEATLGTSSILEDTDGDGLLDGDEVTSGGFDPRIANLPKISITVVGAPTIELDVKSVDTGETLHSYNASYSQGQQSSYSRSDTTATSTTVEESSRVYSEVEASASITGGYGGSAKVGAEASVSSSATQEDSTSITQASAQDSRQEFGRYKEDTSGLTNTTEDGRLSVELAIENVSDLSYELSRVEVIAKKHGENGVFQPVGTLRFEPTDDGSAQDIGPGDVLQKVVIDDDATVPLLKSLMENPSGLLFTVGNYVLDKVGDEEGRSFARLNQDISAQTAQVVIDYGDHKFDSQNTVEEYMVATNVDRDPATNEPLGISVSRVMTEILGVGFDTEQQAVVVDGTDTGDRRAALSEVRDLESISVEEGFWYVYSNSDSLDDPAVDFGDIVLMARDRITMVYLKDSDGDGVFDREEYILGTDPTESDTDEDQLSDELEAKTGWTVNISGNARTVFSDPLNQNVDGDDWDDLEERDNGTDPNLKDTDDDGLLDHEDPDPTGFSVLAFDIDFNGPQSLVEANGRVSPPADTSIDRLLIDWGDGSSADELTPVDTDVLITDLFHQYTGSGDFTITVTAEVADGPDEERTYDVAIRDRFAADIGEMLNDYGWNETMDTRSVADLNGDGMVDLIGFGATGVWTSMANGSGYDIATRIDTLDTFATAGSFDKATQRRMLAHVGGDSAPDIVMFALDGVYVAINDGTGGFEEPVLWIDDFGVDHGYLNFADYPRDLGDITGDGRSDVVGWAANGVRTSISSGSSFLTSELAIGSVGASFGWTSAHPRTLGDINGDGYADIVSFGQPETHIYINDPNGHFSAAQTYAFMTAANGSYFADRHPRVAVDIDADGKDDLFTYANAGTYVSMSNTDTVAGGLTQLSSDYGYDDGYRLGNDVRRLADINGDGLLDIVGFGPDVVNVPGGVYYSINGGGEPGAVPQFEDRVLWLTEFATGVNGDTYNNAENPRFVAHVNDDASADLIVFDDDQLIVVFSVHVDD